MLSKSAYFEKFKAYPVRYSHWYSSCAASEVIGFSSQIPFRSLVNSASDYEQLVSCCLKLVKEMEQYPGSKSSPQVNPNTTYGSFEQVHLTGCWNETSDEQTENKAFIEALTKRGWKVVEGGTPPHGGMRIWFCILTPNQRFKNKEEDKRNEDSREGIQGSKGQVETVVRPNR